MRIGIIAPLEMRVPPVAYGGTELVVSLLTEELARRGQDVTLYASGDSRTRAKLKSVCPAFLRGSGRDKQILNLLNVVACLRDAKRLDIIHNHTLTEGMAAAALSPVPVLTTLHGNLSGDQRVLFEHYAGWYNTISHACKERLPQKPRYAGTVYNAIDVPSYPFNGARRESGLLFLSRMSREKGPHLAIDVAQRCGLRLILAGNVDTPDEEYFKSAVLPRVDGDQIRYVGEADNTMKRELLSSAYALLAPITWPEPFGLFMVEAMACGTPVIAFNRGAAPEVVRDGETGFIVSTVEEMAAAVARVDKIEPARCREWVARRFDAPRMAADYLAAYRRILEGDRPRDAVAPRIFRLPLDAVRPAAQARAA